ncbi:mannitol dehydrogenase family protein [Allosphingosinicella sp.]|uniref:mannitol dehydrogenase family protein n=1 Tax=Allosphingosinicella sp. TaxID=2823234 RepID=UPI002EE19862
MTPPIYRDRLTTGMVHFGPGAFHRAHQADYVHRLLADDPRWGIAAVSLRSAATVEALRAQQGLYTLAILDEQTSFRTIGAHSLFFGPGHGRRARQTLLDPAVRIVSTTVTEKGYCLAGDGTLDFDHPDIVRDLAAPDEPVSIVGWLALGLRDRRDSGAAPFATLCCDNMVSNGSKLGAAVRAFAERLDPELALWIAGEAGFPDSMVDSIVPATTDALRALVRESTGEEDSIPVSREAYSAWIVEDVLPPGGPDLAAAGVILTGDVSGHELAKLRILNGAHSTLAYLGLLLGHETVADAMDDPRLAAFMERLVREDIVPTILSRAEFDLDRYADDILGRFRNPVLAHELAQIAWDGSQKLPYRLLDTIADARSAGWRIDRLAVPVAAWMRFVQRRARSGLAIVDPLADRLSAIGRGPAEDLVDEMLAIRQIFPADLAADEGFAAALRAAVRDEPASLIGEVNA